MKHEVKQGQTDYTVLVLIRDTAGAPKTGLTSASIDIAYARVETDNDVTTADVTPASLSALTDAHSDWGFLEVSATDHPGLYRLDFADAVFAAGAWSAVVSIVGTGLDPTHMEFVLVPEAPYDGVEVKDVVAAALNAIADGVLSRNVSNVEGTAPEHCLATIVLGSLEFSISGTTLTIKRTDGSTTHYTKTLTKDAAAQPITAIA